MAHIKDLFYPSRLLPVAQYCFAFLMATMVVYPETVQYRQVISDASHYAYRSPENGSKQLPKLNFIGTVKLRGTNTAVGFSKCVAHWCQSRNRVITPEEDHAGFAQYMNPLVNDFFSNHVLAHCSTIRQHYEQGDTIVIFGEWCGGTIQQNVALCGLPTMFVIFKIRIITPKTDDHKSHLDKPRKFWLEPTEWRNVRWHEHFIYNIFDFPTYEIQIDFNKPELSKETLTKITEQVEQQCPVGAYFNSIGVGEGVVWTEWTQSQGDLTFKVKGQKHLVSQANALVSITVTKIANMEEFVEYACTENRMRQALDYMHEQMVSIEVKNINLFLRWLTEDIIKEEKDTIDASNINPSQVHRSIKNKAEAWYLDAIANTRKINSKRQRGGKK